MLQWPRFRRSLDGRHRLERFANPSQRLRGRTSRWINVLSHHTPILPADAATDQISIRGNLPSTPDLRPPGVRRPSARRSGLLAGSHLPSPNHTRPPRNRTNRGRDRSEDAGAQKERPPARSPSPGEMPYSRLCSCEARPHREWRPNMHRPLLCPPVNHARVSLRLLRQVVSVRRSTFHHRSDSRIVRALRHRCHNYDAGHVRRRA